MSKARYAFLIATVILTAAATITLAYLAMGIGMKPWMAAMGPVLLGLTLFLHLRGQKR